MLPAKLDNPSVAPRTKMAAAENYCTSLSFPLAYGIWCVHTWVPMCTNTHDQLVNKDVKTFC